MNIKVDGNRIKLSKLKGISFAQSREVEGRILSAINRRNATGERIVNPKTYRKYEKQLSKWQRIQSRRKKGVENETKRVFKILSCMKR